MKKIFTLAMLSLLTAGTASAQTTLRKTWDFREGFSTKTVNALKADQEEFGTSKYWRNYESDATKADEQHFWNASADFKNADKYACTHNGGVEKVIDELDGLKFTSSTAAKKVVITYNSSQSANEGSPNGMFPYGTSFLWINGKNESFTFEAACGQKIRIGVESHSNSQNRGIGLTTTNGSLELVSGEPTPTFFNECIWNLSGSESETATLTVKSTNGCHIYYIIVGEGDDPDANKTKVAYLTDGDAESETAYATLKSNTQFVVTAMTDWSSLDPKAYDAIVFSPSIAADKAESLKSYIAFYPVLNLNADLCAAWGYSEKATSEPFAIIKNLKSDLFADFVLDQDYIQTDDIYGMGFEAEQLTGVKFGSFFAGDDSLATDALESLVYIHAHNLYHNAYIYLPQEAVTHAKLMANAINSLKSSKSEITKVSAPKITLEYKNLNTNITLAMASSNMPKPHIYYTLDGTDPTETSTEYTEPINVTTACTVKAVAIAEGYLLSDVASAEVGIFSQPATPVISQTWETAKTTVNIACETEGVDIWYNYKETNDTAQSMKYTEPITIKAPVTLTAFSVVNGQVFSELATQRIVVKDAVVRRDVIGHFDANTEEWGTNASGSTGSTVYHFSWGKNASSIYDTTKDPISTTVDPVTGDETNVYPEKDYEYWIPSTECAWELKSKGQVMIYQTLSVGKDAGNAGGYNPETTGDIIDYANITSNDIQFGGKVSGEPYTAAIQSRVKFQAPFDVITYIGTAAGGSNVGKMMVQVSTDSLTWTNVSDSLATSTVKRLWKSYVTSYDGTDEVYVRLVQAGGGSSVQIYDIYVLNFGETSAALKKQFDEEFTTGIETVSDKKSRAAQGIYNINGVRMQSLRRGLNIVVMGDGTVRKVMVK